MYLLFFLLLQVNALFLTDPLTTPATTIAPGHLPVVVAEPNGRTHLVFGQDSTIYYATSTQSSFNTPAAIAVLPDLVAGAKRGPQLAVTDAYVVITAVNRQGDVFAYSLNRASGKWSSGVRINDVPEIAKEGFQAVTGAAKGTFHAVWLDLRVDKRNKIMGSTSRDGGHTWSANQVVYQSPDGTVCECCKVSIVAKNNDVYVQFRNWLNGSRDLYLARSSNGGQTFASVQKLGTGTWKLTACPMDGGQVVLSQKGEPLTAWRRENTLYTCQPGQDEQPVANGRNVTMTAGPKGPLLAWDSEGMVWVKSAKPSPIALGKGQMPSLAVARQKAICVWELDGQIMMATIQL